MTRDKAAIMRDLTLSIPAGFFKRKAKSSVSVKILNLSILAGIIFFSLVYFFEINALGTRGYAIRNLQQQISSVEADQKNLQMQASNLQSIDRIQQQAQQLDFVPVNNVTYLKDSDFALK